MTFKEMKELRQEHFADTQKAAAKLIYDKNPVLISWVGCQILSINSYVTKELEIRESDFWVHLRKRCMGGFWNSKDVINWLSLMGYSPTEEIYLDHHTNINYDLIRVPLPDHTT